MQTFSALGTNKLSYTDVDQELNMYTGGVRTYPLRRFTSRSHSQIGAKTIASPHPDPARPHIRLMAVSASCLCVAMQGHVLR